MSTFKNLSEALCQNKDFYNIVHRMPNSKYKKFSGRTANRITHLIIHHTATNNMGIQDIAEMHIKERSWPGIAYHIIIEPSGVIFQVNNFETTSYHCEGYNSRSISICFNADLENSKMSGLAFEASRSVLLSFALNFKELIILPHKSVKPTLCPGQNSRFDELSMYYKSLIFEKNNIL